MEKKGWVCESGVCESGARVSAESTARGVWGERT